jgi:ComF family protein
MVIAAALFPGTCPGCGARGEPICGQCRGGLRRAPALPPPTGLDALVVPFAYDGVVREVIARAKYRARHAALPWLAAAMVTELRQAPTVMPHSRHGTVLSWAPTTASRRRDRGFDQAELLARRIGRMLHLPVARRLIRVGDLALTGASAEQRTQRVGFRVRSVAPGERVLVVDDVVTTGATMRAAAGVLRAAGASAVVGLAAARRR